MTVYQSIIQNNLFINNQGAYGGAISTNANNMIIINNTFINNSAQLVGGAFYHSDYGFSIDDTLVTFNYWIMNNTFSDCSSTYGGAIYLTYTDLNNINNIYNYQIENN